MSEPFQEELWKLPADESISSAAASHSYAKTSALRAKALGLTDHEADCGGRCCGWCARCDPVGYSLRTWVLCAAEAMTGYTMIWSRQVTPLDRSWWVLNTLERRTSGNGYGSWPTATVMDSAGFMGKPDKGRMGPNSGNTLTGKVVRTFPTPSANDGEMGAESRETKAARGSGGVNLREAAGWPTPRAEDSEQTGAHAGAPDTLTSAARTWPTPCANEDKYRMKGNSQQSKSLTPMCRKFAGPQDQAKSSTHGKPQGSLNSRWVASLMGYPKDWCELSPEFVVVLMAKPKHGSAETKSKSTAGRTKRR